MGGGEQVQNVHTSNQHGLILGICHHLLVGTIRDGKQMGGHLIPPLANVHLDHPVAVDGITLVGVDHNAEEARVGLNKGLELNR